MKNKSNIQMQPGAEILVRSGAELFPSKFSLSVTQIFGCKRMWRGIRVEDNATFTSLFTFIRDAQYAVTLGSSTITANLEAIAADIATIDEQLLTATPQAEAALLAQKDALTQQAITLMGDLANVGAQIAAWRTNEITNLIAANIALVPSANYQQYEKDVNRLYLDNLAQGITTFTTAQQALINGIADLCPSTHGKAVLAARRLKQYYEPGYNWDLDECMPVESHSGEGAIVEETNLGAGVHIFPNPAQSSFTIQFAVPLEAGAVLSVSDMTGKLRAAHTLSIGADKKEVDASTLRPGIYVVEVRSDGRVLANTRITIID